VLDRYIERLGQSAQKQIVVSSFHLCTEVYPEPFLQLSVSARMTLQQNIRQIGSRLVEALQELQRSIQNFELNDSADPTLLFQAWETLEQGIMQQFQDSSRQLNHQLQDSQVMQIKSLDKLLDTAVKAEAAGRTVTNPPHLLKALIDPDEETEDGLEPVVALYLQVGDLEFTDPELMGWRQKLRPLLQKLSQVQQSFAQKQEEQLVAEAIAAWNATWIAEDATTGGSMGQ
ncbi:MAG TPA: hypothetical protein V6D19_05220, partial [Stenomitos sp.]